MIRKILSMGSVAFVAGFLLVSGASFLVASHLKHTMFASAQRTGQLGMYDTDQTDALQTVAYDASTSTAQSTGGCGCPTCCALN